MIAQFGDNQICLCEILLLRIAICSDNAIHTCGFCRKQTITVVFYHNTFGWFSLVEEDGRITQLLWEDRTEGFRSDVLKDGLNQLEAYFAGKLTKFDLPLAPAGTDFQQQVYRIMQDIPFGEVMTYGEVAKKLGEYLRVHEAKYEEGILKDADDFRRFMINITEKGISNF